MPFKLMLTVLALQLLGACTSTGQLFKNSGNAPDNNVVLRQYFHTKEPVIKPGDKITVSIWGHDELSVGSVNSVYSANEASGRWLVVGNDGEVNLPQIGRVKVGGYNLKEVNYVLEAKYATLMKDPIINLKVLNHYVTVLGEVKAPGKYPLNNERVNLIEMLAQAGGLSLYAQGDHIRVIRNTVNNTPVELQVDLTELATLAEFNVVLQPNDIVYVGANRKKDADNRLRRATTVSGILTGLAVVASVLIN